MPWQKKYSSPSQHLLLQSQQRKYNVWNHMLFWYLYCQLWTISHIASHICLFVFVFWLIKFYFLNSSVIRQTWAYQGVRNVRFWKNLACFVFLKHPFWDSPFCLITDELYLHHYENVMSRLFASIPRSIYN